MWREGVIILSIAFSCKQRQSARDLFVVLLIVCHHLYSSHPLGQAATLDAVKPYSAGAASLSTP